MIGTMVGGAIPAFERLEVTGPNQRLNTVAGYALPVASTVPKYVLPAAGVGLAVQGVSSIIDAARAQQTEGTAGL